MSDNWIVLIPQDPQYLPTPAQQESASRRLREFLSEADEIKVSVSPTVQYFDCGGNFESVACPHCGTHLDDGWWPETMSEDYDDGFKLAQYELPCCARQVGLQDLVYEKPQGFGKFGLSAMNPGFADLNEQQLKELEEILGTKLQKIYRHI